jgi:UDP-2,3-diacylglucosamine hydrolase
MTELPATPPRHELAAPAHWQAIEFVSDLHLSEQTPATWAAFRHYLLSTDADAVLLLGDIFEAWIGDDSAGSGFERECVELLLAASRRLDCGFMVGNRDFLVGTDLLRRCGLFELPDPTVLTAFGQRLLLTHGDALCIADTDYQQFRAMVRNPRWQAGFLAQPIEARRVQVRAMRDASEKRQRELAPQDYADVDAAAALQWLRDAGAAAMVHGHTHRPASLVIAPPFMRHVLSDWDLDDAAHPRAQVLRLSAQGLERRPAPAAPAESTRPAGSP